MKIGNRDLPLARTELLPVLAATQCYCTKMYPMVLMPLFPLSPQCLATFPHVLESSGYPPAPNPILESHEAQSFSLLPRSPILTLEKTFPPLAWVLNPSLLQLGCREACEPISVFHVSRPSEVARYFSSALSEYRELASLLMRMNLSC